MATAEIWPVVEPFGIVVDHEISPSAFVNIAFEAMAGIPGTASENVTRAPASGLPSGLVTTTDSRIGSGSFERLIVYVEAPMSAFNLPEPFRTEISLTLTLPAGSVTVSSGR
jgi:hypothetical protein